MSKSKIVLLSIFIICLSWIFTIFPGHYLEAKFSTWPVLENLKILTPQAPIVITNKETIRVSDSGDVIQALKDSKSKLSLIVTNINGVQTPVGSAVNLTSDGSFVTSVMSFSGKTGQSYFILLDDGTLSPILQRTEDDATGLVFFTADLKDVPVISFGQPEELEVGDKVIFAQSSLTPYSAKSNLSYVASSEDDLIGQVFQSDHLTRCFSTQVPSGILPGQALLNTSGELLGIFSGSQIVCTDAVRGAQALFFNNKQNIARPSFGFEYQILSTSQSQMLNLPKGWQVKSVDANSPAQKAGLAAGDIITALDGQDVTTLVVNPDDLLQKYGPADTAVFSVSRAGKILTLKLTVGQLKQ